jgi:hypothetical protein
MLDAPSSFKTLFWISATLTLISTCCSEPMVIILTMLSSSGTKRRAICWAWAAAPSELATPESTTELPTPLALMRSLGSSWRMAASTAEPSG